METYGGSTGIIDHYERYIKKTVNRWIDETIFMTVATYDRFMAANLSCEARSLYLHLLYTARLQKTNRVWANDKYLKRGLRIGRDRLKKAKKELIELKLIEYCQDRKDDGTLGTMYIEIKYIVTKDYLTGGLKNRPTDNRSCGKQQQMLKESNQMLKENKLNALRIQELASGLAANSSPDYGTSTWT